MLLLQWSRIFVLDYPGAYRTVTLLVSPHASVCRETPGVPYITQYSTGLTCESSWEFYVADCFRCVVQCNATYNKMTHLRVSSTLGRALHFRVNTDVEDWEHPGPECGSVEKQSLREQNEWQPESLCRVHNAEKMIKSSVSRSLCCAWVKLPRIIFSKGFFSLRDVHLHHLRCCFIGHLKKNLTRNLKSEALL